jgi:toxin ParE1/3/4
MSRTLVVTAAAAAEIDRASDWYEQHSPPARLGFLRALDRTIGFIVDHPEQYQIAYRETRRALVSGFPYILFYTFTDRRVVVLACIHTARDPNLWS